MKSVGLLVLEPIARPGVNNHENQLMEDDSSPDFGPIRGPNDLSRLGRRGLHCCRLVVLQGKPLPRARQHNFVVVPVVGTGFFALLMGFY